jgi:hypothetical protein
MRMLQEHYKIRSIVNIEFSDSLFCLYFGLTTIITYGHWKVDTVY